MSNPSNQIIAAVKSLRGPKKKKAGEKAPNQANILIGLANDAVLFHAPNGTAYADIKVGGHRETWSVRSKGFRRWLAKRFFEKTGGAANSEAMQSALGVIEAKAHFDAEEREVHIRVAGHGTKIYLDLGDAKWRAVEVDSDGWRIIDAPPVRFRRTPGMLAIPEPVKGGKIDDLRQFLNVSSDAVFVLVVAWLLAALRDRGPYPILVLIGEQGSAKSTAAIICRKLIDPNTTMLRSLPREDRDLFISANNSHCLPFDNISRLQDWIADALCRLATGGGFSTRRLHTDDEEETFDVKRPLILNGIEEIVSRPDLADRCLFLLLERISEDKRKTEEELWADFEPTRPRILGVLLDAMAAGLKNLPNTRLEKKPRMADFALWAAASTQFFWPEGDFIKAYQEDREAAVETMLEADAIASAVCTYMATQIALPGEHVPTVTKTAGQFLEDLNKMVAEKVSTAKSWPTTARAFRGMLARAASTLREVGISVTFGSGKGRSRRDITIAGRPKINVAAEQDGASTVTTVTTVTNLAGQGPAGDGGR
jgi:hypothetical protein